MENHRRSVTADQVRDLVRQPRHPGRRQAGDRPRPTTSASTATRSPTGSREQTQLRDGTCVFPWCTRPARSCDCDHVIAYDQGGTTCSCNIAPLCRRHHRLKTHSPWTYTALEPGPFLWSSPHGYQFLRDHQGTLDVTGDRRPPDPPTPPTSSSTAPHPAVTRIGG